MSVYKYIISMRSQRPKKRSLSLSHPFIMIHESTQSKICRPKPPFQERLRGGLGEVLQMLRRVLGENQERFRCGLGEIQESFWRGFGEVQERLRRGLGEVQEKFWRGLGEAQERFRRGLGEVQDRFRRSLEEVQWSGVSYEQVLQQYTYE